MKRSLFNRLALPTSAAVLALGAVACEVEDGGTEPGGDPSLEDPSIEEDGTIEDGDL